MDIDDYRVETSLENVISILDFSRILCTKEVPKTSLKAFAASQLISIGKNPGLQQIGVDDVLRRIEERLSHEF